MKRIALSQGDTLSRDLLPEPIRGYRGKHPATQEEDKPLSERSLEDIECMHVSRVLEATGWHKGNACEILAVSRPRLRRMIKQYNLEPPEGYTDKEADK